MTEKKPQVKDLIGSGRYRYRIIEDHVDSSELLQLGGEELSTMHPADLAERMEELTLEEQVLLIRKVPAQHAAEVIGELEEEEIHSIANSLLPNRLSMILEAMPTDEAADLLGQMPDRRVENILKQMSEITRLETMELMAHPEDSAGGVMEKELVDFYESTSVTAAVDKIRKEFDRNDFLTYLYITNHTQRLLGVVSLKELVLAPSNRTLGDIMNPDVVSVNLQEDQEKVAFLATKYGLQAIPVIDDEGKLMGIVSPEDISDIIEEEHREDMYRMAGVHEDSGIFTNPIRAAFLRFPWLIATVIGGMFSAHIIETHQALDQIWMLSFSPLILGLAGNVAIQTSTVIIRNLSTRQFSQPLSFKYFVKEANTGVVLALLCGLTLGVIVSLVQGSTTRGLTLGLSLSSVIMVSVASSILIPVGFNRFNIDPAIASGPLVTTLTDLCGLIIYFNCSYLVLKYLASGG